MDSIIKEVNHALWIVFAIGVAFGSLLTVAVHIASNSIDERRFKKRQKIK